jgi:hypothetical protein
VADNELPLWPGPKLAVAWPTVGVPRGWLSFRPDKHADLPLGRSDDPMHCGQWCPPDWGFPPVVCTDHGEGYHAAAVSSPSGPRIIAVWLDDQGKEESRG